jgi:hypothetical protein
MAEEPSIEELCRPLSAKDMPRSATRGMFGDPITEQQAIGKQRQTHRHGPTRVMPRPASKTKA